MTEHRWSKFWWQDWQREPSLRMCSLSARGLWIELLAIAHDGEPYGHVTINGKAPTPKQIGGIVGCSEKESAKFIAELEDAGVFSRTELGVIFSRRMVRDHQISEKGRQDKLQGMRGNGSSPPSSSPVSHPSRGGKRGPTSLYSESESEADPPLNPPQGGLKGEIENKPRVETKPKLRKSVEEILAVMERDKAFYQ